MNPTSCSCTCGCCEGITIATPQPTANPPGQPALACRVGTHATFLETMIARLSAQDHPALAALKTRDPADPSLALLDGWALVADILTFYQERIANEGYLRTATQRRSVLELARLLGYQLRPGVASSVYLAYTLDEDRSQTPPAPTETLIAAGSRSQSVPGPGQSPQFFETSDDLDARSEWNNLAVRLTQPPRFTNSGTDSGTDIGTRHDLYFSGTATNLKPGDPLILALGAAAGAQALRLVQSLTAQPAQNRTYVTLQPVSATKSSLSLTGAILPVTSGADQTLALGRLTKLLTPLSLPPSLQPANASRLARTVNQAFSQTSDMAPRLLAAFRPAAAPNLYQAWAGFPAPVAQAQVGAARIKTGLFPGTYPGLPTTSSSANAPTNAVGGSGETLTTQFNSRPTMATAWQSLIRGIRPLQLEVIALDSVYDKILAGSWVLIDRPNLVARVDAAGGQQTTNPPRRIQSFHKILSVAAAAMTTADGGFSTKVTQLTLDPPWLADQDQKALDELVQQKELLPGTVVYAQTELLDLADEPVAADLAGRTIELDRLYDGLESGRWIIVSGERTDLPNVTGVTASELVMILGVAQVDTSPNGQLAPVHTSLTLANALAYKYDPATVTIYGNVVQATNGQTNNETLGNGDGSQTFQEFTLKQNPLTFVPATNPQGVNSTLAVYVNNVAWQETATLAALGPRDHGYVTQTADDGSTSVIFGNGVEGARLPTGFGNVQTIYRNGIGQAGNVDAGQITLLQTRPLNVNAVTNPLPATGGADRDTLDQARKNVPLSVMSLDRLVSLPDYADFALTFAGIGKAASARLSDGSRVVVHLTIAGAEDIPIAIPSDLYTNLVQAFQTNGDPCQPLQVAVRTLRVLVISAQVAILPAYLWEDVAARLRAALLATFSFDNRSLGQPVFQSEVISALQAVAGVAYVTLQVLDSVAENSITANPASLASRLQLKAVVPAALARPNPAPANDPTDRILPAEMVYLNATLPDTLILNQVPS
jgi:predicted phage baseplate assembly protein